MYKDHKTTTFQEEAAYTLAVNGIILFLSLIQNWSSSDLFLFLFMQSVLQGFVTLAVLIALNLRRENFMGICLHLIFFLLHYYLFTAVIIFGVYYDSGYITLQTLAKGLTDFFAVSISEGIVVSSTFSLLNIVITLSLFLLILIFRTFQKYKNFYKSGRSYAEIHISPYSKHLLIFFFVFMLSVTFLEPLIGSSYTSFDSDIANQGILITFFVSLSIIEVSMMYAAKKLSLI